MTPIELRHAIGLSQAEMAKFMHCSKRTIIRAENDDNMPQMLRFSYRVLSMLYQRFPKAFDSVADGVFSETGIEKDDK